VKRWTVTILLFLVLGAVVNVVVAWTFLYLVDATTAPRESAHGGVSGDFWDGDPALLPYDGCVAYRQRAIGTERVTFDQLIWHRGPLGPRRTSNPSVEDLMPSWGTRCLTQESEPDSGRSPLHMATCTSVEGRGWPLLSMWGGVTELRPGHTIRWPEDSDEERLPWVHSAVLLEPTPAGCQLFGGRATILPLHPIWPGFAVNTLFYAFVLCLLYGSPLIVYRLVRRHHIRVKHGLCPKCGYDLRGAIEGGCPECGWNREEATA
jgi:hypothetical protein